MNHTMTPINWAKRPIMEKYADFSGRAPRAEYWWYTLALIIVATVLSIFESILGIKGMLFGMYGPLTGLLILATIVPGLAVGVRRLHDTNRSAWWLLLMLPYFLSVVMIGAAAAGGGGMAGLAAAGAFGIIGLLCAIGFLVLMVLPSTPGDNRYGPNPYGETETGPIAAE
ncbi:MAG TPA: DUF805 domain-containing protein [Sphingomicrobium sp.]|nr:DUF805 domain-containing protein [Sphingomicrobium sp.]